MVQTTGPRPATRGGAGQPVRGVLGGAALHLPQQPLLAGRVKEAGVPPVRQQGVFPGLLIDGEPGPAAAANASCATGQETPACRAASAGVIPRSVTSAPACSRSRVVIRHRGGTAGTHSVNVFRRHSALPHLRRTLTHRRSTGSAARRTSRGRTSTVSCTRPEIVPQAGHAAAAG